MASQSQKPSSISSSLISLDTSTSNTSTVSTESNGKTIRQYPKGHPGPYIVHIKSVTQKLNYNYVSNYLFESRNGIKACEKVSQSLCKVECKTSTVANEIPKDRNLSRYDVYIPVHCIGIEGVIYYPTINDVDEILDNSFGIDMTSGKKVNIIGALRFNSKSHIESPLVRITFAGHELPTFLVMNELDLIRTKRANDNWFYCRSCHMVQIPVRPYMRKVKQDDDTSGKNVIETKVIDKCFTCFIIIERETAKLKALNIQSQNKEEKRKPESKGFQGLTETECP